MFYGFILITMTTVIGEKKEEIGEMNRKSWHHLKLSMINQPVVRRKNGQICCKENSYHSQVLQEFSNQAGQVLSRWTQVLSVCPKIASHGSLLVRMVLLKGMAQPIRGLLHKNNVVQLFLSRSLKIQTTTYHLRHQKSWLVCFPSVIFLSH